MQSTASISASAYISKRSPFALTAGQRAIIDSMDSARITLIPERCRASGKTTTVLDYIEWELQHVSIPISIAYYTTSDNQKHEIHHRFGYHRSNDKNRYCFDRGSTLNIRSIHSKSPNEFKGFPPDDVVVIDWMDIRDRSIVMDHLEMSRAYVGRQMAYREPVSFMQRAFYEYDSPKIITKTYEGSRYVITVDDTYHIANDFVRLGVPAEDIDIIGSDLLTVVDKNYRLHP